MKRNAKWTVYLKPNWSYDVSVTMGARTDSINNLNVTGDSSTYILARSFFKKNLTSFLKKKINLFLFLLFSFFEKQ